MFPARLNWETFASTTMFPQQCFLVYPRKHCCGNNVSCYIPGVANLGNMFRTQNLCPGSKNAFDSKQKQFLFSEQQNLFPQHVSRAAKLGNICIRNNVSATMFLSFSQALRTRQICIFDNEKQ